MQLCRHFTCLRPRMLSAACATGSMLPRPQRRSDATGMVRGCPPPCLRCGHPPAYICACRGADPPPTTEPAHNALPPHYGQLCAATVLGSLRGHTCKTARTLNASTMGFIWFIFLPTKRRLHQCTQQTAPCVASRMRVFKGAREAHCAHPTSQQASPSHPWQSRAPALTPGTCCGCCPWLLDW